MKFEINKFGFVEELNENTQQNEINLINEEENNEVKRENNTKSLRDLDEEPWESDTFKENVSFFFEICIN